jgi:hypothetical protein
MLTTALIKFFVDFLVLLSAALPNYTPPPAVDLSAFQVIAWLVPINEIVTLSAGMAAFAVASLLYFAFNWVINKGLHSG